MKQTFTIENELAMIKELLTDMVENGSIEIEEADQILQDFFTAKDKKNDEMLPNKQIVNNIMNYSKSLDVVKPPGSKPMTMIVN